jgi:DNA (cytosine-5)-methyltransferase 1
MEGLLMKVLDLFSGIGGFTIGLERAGFETIAFCEEDEFCQRVLSERWPHVPIYEDVKTLRAKALHAAGLVPDIVVGGFPCQDISYAGKRKGLVGKRSKLWIQFARLLRELRPSYAIVENTAGLLSLGMGDVLLDLA